MSQFGRKKNVCECQWRKTLNDVLRLVMMMVVVHSIRIIKINWKCKTQICPAWSSFPQPVRKVTLRFQRYPSWASYVVPGGKPILCRYLRMQISFLSCRCSVTLNKGKDRNGCYASSVTGSSIDALTRGAPIIGG